MPLPDGNARSPIKSHPQTAATHTAPKGRARLSATQILDGYRAGDFTPRDVIDEVIVALEDTDALCKVMTTDMFASARAEADRAAAAWKGGEAKALTGVPITVNLQPPRHISTLPWLRGNSTTRDGDRTNVRPNSS
jgi:hypothetical protein